MIVEAYFILSLAIPRKNNGQKDKDFFQGIKFCDSNMQKKSPLMLRSEGFYYLMINLLHSSPWFKA
jgi:hypothetical protein